MGTSETAVSGIGEEGKFDRLLARLPARVVESLDPEEVDAISAAVQSQTWRTHPIDVRQSFGLFGRRFYVTLVAGEEQRSPERRAVDREAHPMHSVGNLFLFLGIASLFYIAAVFALAVHSAIVEF